MDINNTQYGILMSSVTLVNTILPLFAGGFIDDFHSSIGTIRGTLVVSIIIFIGSLMVTIGANMANFNIMLAGQVIYGLGDGIIVTFQEAILSRWFRDKQLAIVVGLMLCVARLAKFVAKLICYPLVNAAGTFTEPIYVAMVLCGVSVVTNFIYGLAMWKAGYATIFGKELSQPNSGYHIEFVSAVVEDDEETKKGKRHQQKKGFQFKYSMLLYLPSIFWMIPWLQISMSSVLSSFDDISTEYVQFRFSTTSVMAGYQSSLTQAVPIIAAPLLGLYIHQYGKRLYILFAGTIVLILALLLLAYTWVTPSVGMILISLALSLGPVAIMSSTSFLLPSELAGIGVGLHKCSNNIGTTIIAIIVGYIQDLTYHDGNAADDQTDLLHEYEQVMIFYLVVAGIGLLLSCIFWYMDKKYLNNWLQINRIEREQRLLDVREHSPSKKQQVGYNSEEDDPTAKSTYQNALKYIGSQLRSTKSYLYLGIWSSWSLVAWVVFFTFALMPIYEDYGDDYDDDF
jgi:MFS family permease